MDNKIINVNDINPQLFMELVEKVDRLEKMLFNYDAKGVKKGVLKGIKIQQATETVGAEPEIILSEIYKNANGGTLKINDINGNLNVALGSESGTGDNIGGTIVIYNDGDSLTDRRAEIGISKEYDNGIINLRDASGTAKACLYANSNVGPVMFLFGEQGSATMSYITPKKGMINNQPIITKDAMDEAIQLAIDDHVSSYHSSPPPSA